MAGAELAGTSSILVVDDDLSNRESLRRRLERRGYSVAAAADGFEALAMMDVEKFDLVILDVMMPGMSGLEVLKKIRTRRSPNQLPVIMATAKDDSADVVLALDQGASDYVTKPLDFAVVLARVQTQLLLKRSFDQIVELEQQVEARNVALESANARLNLNAERAARDLKAAADVQKAFLPRIDPVIDGLRFAWIFQPCDELAGDCLNIIQLDEQHVAFYVLDVSGHGVAASLLAVAASRLLSVVGEGDSILLTRDDAGKPHPAGPAEVALRLTQRFGWDTTSGQFLTLFYAVYNITTRQLDYVSAGHPGAIRITPGAQPRILEGSGMPIGIGETYAQQTAQLSSGDRIYLYSDGVTEAMNADKALFGRERLVATLQSGEPVPLQKTTNAVVEEIARWRGDAATRDDLTILGMQIE